MSKEIKFGAWDKFNEDMFYSDNYNSLADFFLEKEKREKGGNHIVVRQYIGLKDKSGTECYEGDIKEWRFNHHIWVSVCYWSVIDCGFRWRRVSHNSKFEDRQDEYETEEDFNLGMQTSSQRGSGLDSWSEIIGNIYENPELMETTHE